MPSRVPPHVFLPASMDEPSRRELTKILEQHAEQINHISFDTKTVASAGSLSGAASSKLLLVDATATASLLVTLIPAVRWRDKSMHIKRVSTGGVILVTGNGSETISDEAGSVTTTVTLSSSAFTLVSDGVKWHRV